MYFLSIDEQQAGPFTLEYLQTGWKDGTLTPETLFWQEGMAEWQPLETIRPLLERAPAIPGSSTPVDALAPMIIGGFWRRLAAFLVDVLIMGIIGFGSGYFLFKFYMSLGLAGLLVGLVIATAYFGLLNSRLGSGQTLGKRLLGIRVEDAHGNFISPGRSILRYLILALPFFLNKAVVDGLVTNLSTGALLMIPVIAGFVTFTYLLVFNRGTRQMIHDLAIGTYVVRQSSPRPAPAPRIWRGHEVTVAILCLIVAAMGCFSPFILRLPYFQSMLGVRQVVLATGTARTVGVMAGTNYIVTNGHSSTTRLYSVTAFVPGQPRSSEALAGRFAALALNADPGIASYDYFNVSISYGYDIGIASGTVTDQFVHTPEEWKKIAAHPVASP